MKYEKFLNFLLSFFIICSFIYLTINNQDLSEILYESIHLWYFIIIPSILPTYFIGNLLIINNSIFNIIYKLTNQLFHFENKYSCLLFFISFFISNPSITYLIKESTINNEISLNEANKLSRCTNHFSIIYIMKIINKDFILIVILALYLSSIIIFLFSKNNKQNYSNNYYIEKDLYKMFDDSFLLLLKILMIMIFTNILSYLLINLFKVPNNLTIILEITQGINNLNKLNLSTYRYHLYSLIMLSFGGLSLLIQILIVNKKTMDTFNFIKYRIVHLFLSLLLFNIFYLFKFFN